jgi:hypothetical protein
MKEAKQPRDDWHSDTPVPATTAALQLATAYTLYSAFLLSCVMPLHRIP